METPDQRDEHLQILRRDEVLQLIGISRPTPYEWLHDGRFPQPIRLGARSIGWRRSDIRAWLHDDDRDTNLCAEAGEPAHRGAE